MRGTSARWTRRPPSRWATGCGSPTWTPPGHTRLPRYVRRRTGTVTALQPGQVFPDTAAHFVGENPQHCYTVDFDSRELWGPGAEPFRLSIDLFEPYLEPAP